ncbi:MAG: RloB domain-containing protein [Firmicutes bacterium]|nr:RloB domain-containing protein [Bacillota bacterium]
MQNGSLEDAKRRSRKFLQSFEQMGETSPPNMVSATRMHELVEELEQYSHK